MGTSNWQNIPFCVEALMKIEPRRVLDVGVGFGRWGMIVREFCEVWYDRFTPRDWVIEIEGIEGFPANIFDYHAQFYDRIHLGDARVIMPTLAEHWDLVVFGDVLEHFDRSEGERLLNWSLDHATYVIVNIPLGSEWPQEDKYKNPFERHRSEWQASDFECFAARRSALFRDFMDRLFGSFVLSRLDPKDLSASLFSRSTARSIDGLDREEEALAGLDPIDAALLERARSLHAECARLRTEVDLIKRSRSYRVTQRILGSRYGPLLWRTSRRLLPDEGGVLRAVVAGDAYALAASLRTRLPPRVPRAHARVRPLGVSDPLGRGTEVWLLAVGAPGRPSLDLAQMPRPSAWDLRSNPATPTGSCLVSFGTSCLDIPLADDSHIVFMTHPWSGFADVASRHARLRIDLFSEETGTLLVAFRDGGRRIVQWRAPALSHNGSGPSTTGESDAHPADALGTSGLISPYSPEEVEWLARTTASHPTAIALMHPAWRGVRGSTAELFPHHCFLDDHLTEAVALRKARLLLDTGCERIVFSGFAHTWIHLVMALRRLAPSLKLFSLWFGSFLQHEEDYAWQGFRTIEQLCRAGFIYKWGFAKKGMAETMAMTGLHTGFVMSLVRRIPDGPSKPLAGGPHFGIWAAQPTWRKLPYAMVAALQAIPHAHLHASSVGPRLLEFARLLGLQTHLSAAPVPFEDMPQTLAEMHLNLYVTLSECAPMVPLESLSVGVPCLIGPNSHFFEDEPYLHRRLVVPHPDRAETIASHLHVALEERTAIVTAYRSYAPNYNRRAIASLEEFLETPCTPAAEHV
jgi:hypothetical protein